MPACQKCDMFSEKAVVCTGEAKSAIRNCINAFLNLRKDLIYEGFKVLEIGCGYISQIKDLVDYKGGIWYGIDPNPDSIANFTGSVDGIPFDTNYFDIVFASQSIEHWYEYSVTFDEGLSEIHRVLKPTGVFSLDFPVYLHGHIIFMLGKIDSVNSLFNSKSWKIEEVEDWRREYSPLDPYFTWDGTRKKYANEYFCEKHIRKNDKSAYIRSMLVQKNNIKYVNIYSLRKHIFTKILFTSLMYYKYLRISFDNIFTRLLK